MKNAALLLTVLVAGACASQPSTDRPTVDRPEVPRPEGVEPSGLTDMRNAIGEQRTAARARDNALNINPQSLSTNPDQSWYVPVLNQAADVMHFLRNFFQ
jgi:hypothetical protein